MCPFLLLYCNVANRKITLIESNSEHQTPRKLLKVAAYCRVSKKNEETMISLDSQIRHYTELIKSSPKRSFAGIYVDVGSGLRFEKRTGYKKMITQCKKEKINLILVKSVSRFGRDALEIIKQIRF